MTRAGEALVGALPQISNGGRWFAHANDNDALIEPNADPELDMSAIIVGGIPRPAPISLNVVTFADSNVVRFRNQARHLDVSEFILHESVTRSWLDTVHTLQQRRLGVHFICAPDGTIYQHGDLASDLLWHASQHNPVSVGCEVVNPYYPKFAPPGGPWSTVIDAPWADGSKYLLPTPEQCEAMALLTEWLTSEASGLCIPRHWPGLSGSKLAMGPVAACANPTPGVLAHHYFGHADGAFLTLYAWLRLEAALASEVAYAEAARLATDAHPSGVSLAQYVGGPAQESA